VSSTFSDSDSWSDTDWRTTLNMNVTDDVMIYLTGSKAFRAGSFSTSTLAPTTTRPYHLVTIAPVPPEELLNKELGFRTEWIDRRLRFNTTYYDMDFTNRQGASAVADANSPVGFTIQLVNQGDAQLSGIEVEAEFAVTSQFSLDASAGWADYEMADPCINNGLYLFPPPVDRSYTLGGRYEIPMQGGGLTLSASFAHTGPQETHPGGLTAEQATAFGCAAGPGGPPVPTWFRDSRYRVAEFDTLNAVIRYTNESGKWIASLYANNLTDETYANNGQSFGRGYWTAGGPALGLNSVMRGAQADYRARPREVGFSFEYNFF
jgi:iron complex outermembrane receptor protein